MKPQTNSPEAKPKQNPVQHQNFNQKEQQKSSGMTGNEKEGNKTRRSEQDMGFNKEQNPSGNVKDVGIKAKHSDETVVDEGAEIVDGESRQGGKQHQPAPNLRGASV